MLAILAAIKENTAAVRELSLRKETPVGAHGSSPGRADLLLPVLAASVEDKAFSTREVMERAALLDVALRDALAAAGLSNPRQLGKWLRTLEGRQLVGVRLERIGTDHDGIVWRVWRV
jgi:hypothetical protein